MTKDDIITLPNDHLRVRSKKVGFISPEIAKLIQDMKDATIDWENSREHELSVALAAIQIDQPLRVVIVRNDFDNKKDQTFTTLINPVITKFEGQIEEDYEGCLSVPDIYGRVPRYTKIRLRAQDEQGREFRITAEGFLARVIQHELDHTNGMVFIDHIKGNPQAFYRLKDDGHLEKLDYEKDVKTNSILW